VVENVLAHDTCDSFVHKLFDLVAVDELLFGESSRTEFAVHGNFSY